MVWAWIFWSSDAFRRRIWASSRAPHEPGAKGLAAQLHTAVLNWQRWMLLEPDALGNKYHQVGRGAGSANTMLTEPQVVELAAVDAPRSKCSRGGTLTNVAAVDAPQAGSSRNRTLLCRQRWMLLEPHALGVERYLVGISACSSNWKLLEPKVSQLPAVDAPCIRCSRNQAFYKLATAIDTPRTGCSRFTKRY